jgi:formylmethanofuran dehydrogenase subunit C
LIFGQCGNRPAAGMRRGTVCLMGDKPPAILGSFRKSCVYKPLFLELILCHLQSAGFAVPDVCVGASYSQYHGDHVAIGRGEVLIREAAAN